MAEKREMEFINKIVETLKRNDELPYREGAWENFQVTKLKSGKTRTIVYIRYATVAAVLLVVIGLGLHKLQNTQVAHDSAVEESIGLTSLDKNTKDPANPLITERENEQNNESMNSSSIAQVEGEGRQVYSLQTAGKLNGMYDVSATEPTIIPLNPNDINIVGFKGLPGNVHNDHLKTAMVSEDAGLHSLASRNQAPYDILAETNAQKIEERFGGEKQFRFTDKLHLGAFVSPMATDQKMNFGGGLLLRYAISPKLSIRTGLGFQQYEVGKMTDPRISSEQAYIKPAETTASMDPAYDSPTTQYSFRLQSREIIIPNVEAVSAKVESLDIPLEFKYQLGTNFYVAAGASYAIVLGQNRYAHYTDEVYGYKASSESSLPLRLPASSGASYAIGNGQNGGHTLYTDNVYGWGEGTSMQLSDPPEVKEVHKTVESLEKNVSTNGFGGFVNLSLGKKIPFKNKALSFSIEPYLKLPVGKFKSTDLNYTNGGIRIITNFR